MSYKIIILTLYLISLLFIHNIDNAYNMIKYQRDLCKQGIMIDIVDCNLSTCTEPERLYLFSITLLTAIILTIFILTLYFL